MAYDKNTRLLYAWEDQFLEWNCHDSDLTLPMTRKVVRWACKAYRVPAPSVRWQSRRTRKGEYPYYEPETHSLHFQRKLHNLSRTLHETAHAIHDWLFGADGEPHPAEFAGIYAKLIERKKLAPRAAILPSMAAAGVKFVHPSRMTPKAIKARYKRALIEASLARQYGD